MMCLLEFTVVFFFLSSKLVIDLIMIMV